MQSDLLGAHAIGLRNLLIFTGDPRKSGDYSDATLVFDVDSIGLTNAVSRLNRGCDVGGQAIGAPTAFHIGVIANPDAPNLEEEVRRFEYKAEAGAEFAVTPPVFDLEAFDDFRAPHGARADPDRRGGAPVRQPAARRVPRQRGAEHPRARSRCSSACGRAESAGRPTTEGIAIAQEIARELRTRAQGLQIGGPMQSIFAVLDGLDGV